MKFKILILSLTLIFGSVFTSYSNEWECPDCDPDPEFNLLFSVAQPNCGTCFYKVHYDICNVGDVDVIVIHSIESVDANPQCCFATASNDAMLSGYIMDQAGQTLTNFHPSLDIFTRSVCWQWEGTLGPYGIHDAWLVPCYEPAQSCCVFMVSTFTLVENENCFILHGCLRICD